MDQAEEQGEVTVMHREEHEALWSLILVDRAFDILWLTSHDGQPAARVTHSVDIPKARYQVSHNTAPVQISQDLLHILPIRHITKSGGIQIPPLQPTLLPRLQHIPLPILPLHQRPQTRNQTNLHQVTNNHTRNPGTIRRRLTRLVLKKTAPQYRPYSNPKTTTRS